MKRHKFVLGKRVKILMEKKGETTIYGNIVARRAGRFRGRPIIEYKVNFDDGGYGWFHSPEFRKI